MYIQPPKNRIDCPSCGGLGYIMGNGRTTYAKCEDCGGKGEVPYRNPPKHYCPECSALRSRIDELEKAANDPERVSVSRRKLRAIVKGKICGEYGRFGYRGPFGIAEEEVDAYIEKNYLVEEREERDGRS